MVIRNTQQSWMCPVRVSMSAASMVYKINTGKIQTLCTFAQMCHYSWRLQQLVKKWHNKAALPNNKYISNINGLPNQLNPGDLDAHTTLSRWLFSRANKSIKCERLIYYIVESNTSERCDISRYLELCKTQL